MDNTKPALIHYKNNTQRSTDSEEPEKDEDEDYVPETAIEDEGMLYTVLRNQVKQFYDAETLN